MDFSAICSFIINNCLTKIKLNSMTKVNFNFRTEELPPFGEFVEASYTTDKDAFIAFSPQYGDGHAELLGNKLRSERCSSPRNDY